MKKISVYTIVALIALMATTSCVKDFLDIKPRGNDIASKLEHFEGLLDAVNYLSMGSSTYMNMGEELCGDLKTEERLQTSEKDKGLYAFRFDRDPFQSENTCDEWETSYGRIYTANYVINNVMNAEDGTEAQKKRVQAEARMQRAYLHFYASLMFSKHFNESTADSDLSVPIVTKAGTEDSPTYKRATVAELYNFVISEMTESIPFLQDEYGKTRVSKAAGNMLLGKVYWYKGDYSNALTCFRNAMSMVKKFSGTPVQLLSFRDNNATWSGTKAYFNTFPEAGYSSESLLVRYMAQTTYVSATQACLHYFKPEYVAMFKEGDLRAKFLAPSTTNTSMMRLVTRVYYNCMGDLPELYLLLAECEARVGTESSARDVLTEYRKSRFDSDAHAAIPSTVASKDDLIKFIVNERILEYPGRGVSVIDMKRLWDDPLFASKKANFTHPVEGGQTYTLSSVDQLTWKIPLKVMKFHSDWQDN